jgi:iron complex transport system ATP-binding protein
MRLVCRDVSVSFGPCAVLEGVTLDIPEGSFVAVLGVNGAGKSSLLRAIAGLLPFAGDIHADGISIAEMEPRARARRIAFLPQGHEVHWPILARDAVMLGRMPHRSSLAEPTEADVAAVDRALAAADATGLAGRPVTDLSGGERARVLLARALAVEAPLLLADEPIAALDARHQIEVMALFAARARQGQTVLAAVHDLALASRFANRIVVIAGRTIAADGAPTEVLTRELVERVFGVSTVTAEQDGLRSLVPWAAAKR